MKTLYFDCFSGIAGDMAVAALLDLGAPFQEVQRQVDSLGIPELSLDVRPVSRSHVSATQYVVGLQEGHTHRTLGDIRAILDRGDLARGARDLALEIFTRLAEVEGALHNKPADQVSFHEVGAADSIADIVGFSVAWDLLGIQEARCSAIPWSSGSVHCAHGVMPTPAPAALALLKGFELREVDVDGELVTPTGAAILAATASGKQGFGTMRVDAVGYGAGSKDLPGRANVLRAVLGESEGREAGASHGEVVVLEANLDDLDPRCVPALMDALFEAGALDVWNTPVQMKKGRPGLVVSALCTPDRRQALAEVFLKHSTTLGVRFQRWDRIELPRAFETLETRFGAVRFKVAGGRARAEYEDCRKIALDRGMPVAEVLVAVHEDWRAAREKGAE
jgi:uncharacterized protein (TIGR00299 family) protein